MARTISERKDQVVALRAIKPTVRHYSGFGDDHHAAIESQIGVIEGTLSDDDINDIGSDNSRDAAFCAQQWLDGADLEDGPDPASTWKCLVKPGVQP